MIEGRATIKNEQGIHCRPSSAIIKESKDLPGTIEVESEDGCCDLRSIMGLLALGLARGMEVKVTVDGDREEETCRRLVELFETEFDFPSQEAT